MKGVVQSLYDLASSGADSDKPGAARPQGNSPEGAPGRTAGGRATDKHGNVLGPSARPAYHNVDHSTKKEAKDAARQEGKGAPVKHASPAKGKPHYHPTDEKGKQIRGSTHHNYPQ